jgi:hypothetical protein
MERHWCLGDTMIEGTNIDTTEKYSLLLSKHLYSFQLGVIESNALSKRCCCMKRLILLLAWNPILIDMSVCFFLETRHVMPR